MAIPFVVVSLKQFRELAISETCMNGTSILEMPIKYSTAVLRSMYRHGATTKIVSLRPPK